MGKDELVKKLGFNRVKISEPLASHVYMKVGGPADFYYEATDARELTEAIKVAIKTRTTFVILGNGSNILVSDKGFRGLVIKNAAKEVRCLPHGFVEVDSGVENAAL